MGEWNEIDLEIVSSLASNPLSMNVIYGDGEKKNETHNYVRDFQPKDDWHIYELIWTPEFISFMIDTKEVRRVLSSEPAVKLSTKP